MKKVLSVVGARPNFMKVAPLHRTFVAQHPEIEHQICHTGQHYDPRMSDAFFNDLDMPAPAYFLGVGSGSHAEQTARVMVEFEKVCLEAKPDCVIVVGDVNSTIACTLTAAKLHIPTIHVEAGLRSFDRTMPEEINRIATDAICDYCFVTEQSGMDNLAHDGYPAERTFFVGNTMIDSLMYALPKAEQSGVVQECGLTPKSYVLMTLHRPSNVDDPQQLAMLLDVFEELSSQRDVVFPIHPRTRKNMEQSGLLARTEANPRIHLIEPQGYVRFLALMKNADFVMTDSGGIQEETTVLGVPCLTLRTTTERPVTVSLGTNILIQPNGKEIREAMNALLTQPRKKGTVPPLWDGKAAERICEIITTTVLA
ncbi:MAG: UDP-N-acetylglucosamine 2-epimerase (non-hydrolyzing) [Candidatus Kapabacteria bacterium]|nr:UDP-N-acetylglucosamine 2-epimerase (non-hydrolyzing) [Candidatus Kapabacteria bacterium]